MIEESIIFPKLSRNVSFPADLFDKYFVVKSAGDVICWGGKGEKKVSFNNFFVEKMVVNQSVDSSRLRKLEEDS